MKKFLADIVSSLLILLLAIAVVLVGSFIFLSGWTFIPLSVTKLTFMILTAEMFIFSIIISAGIMFPKNK